MPRSLPMGIVFKRSDLERVTFTSLLKFQKVIHSRFHFQKGQIPNKPCLISSYSCKKTQKSRRDNQTQSLSFPSLRILDYDVSSMAVSFNRSKKPGPLCRSILEIFFRFPFLQNGHRSMSTPVNSIMSSLVDLFDCVSGSLFFRILRH